MVLDVICSACSRFHVADHGHEHTSGISEVTFIVSYGVPAAANCNRVSPTPETGETSEFVPVPGSVSERVQSTFNLNWSEFVPEDSRTLPLQVGVCLNASTDDYIRELCLLADEIWIRGSHF